MKEGNVTRQAVDQRRLKAAGICASCCKRPRVTKTHCQECRLRMNERNRLAMQKRVRKHLKRGLCRLCPEKRVTAAFCERHRDYMRAYMREYSPMYRAGLRKKKYPLISEKSVA